MDCRHCDDARAWRIVRKEGGGGRAGTRARKRQKGGLVRQAQSLFFGGRRVKSNVLFSLPVFRPTSHLLRSTCRKEPSSWQSRTSSPIACIACIAVKGSHSQSGPGTAQPHSVLDFPFRVLLLTQSRHHGAASVASSSLRAQDVDAAAARATIALTAHHQERHRRPRPAQEARRPSWPA